MALKEAINRQIITQDAVIPLLRRTESTANQHGAGRESTSVNVANEQRERQRDMLCLNVCVRLCLSKCTCMCVCSLG